MTSKPDVIPIAIQLGIADPLEWAPPGFQPLVFDVPPGEQPAVFGRNLGEITLLRQRAPVPSK